MNIILYFIFIYVFPSPPAYLDPPFIRFSENFPPTLLFGPPRLLGTKEYYLRKVLNPHAYRGFPFINLIKPPPQLFQPLPQLFDTLE